MLFSSTFFHSNDLSSISSSGGMVMLLSSLVISNCEDRVLFLLIHLTGVSCLLLKFYSSYQAVYHFSIEVLSEFVLPCSSFPNGVLSILFISVLCFFSICSTLQGSLVSLVWQRSNLVLPLLFFFYLPSGAILDLGTRPSCSGGVL